jgi:hypothetical protein
MPTCDKCSHFLETNSVTKEGECRRYPPKSDTNKWPIVAWSDFCGEFALSMKDVPNLNALIKKIAEPYLKPPTK